MGIIDGVEMNRRTVLGLLGLAGAGSVLAGCSAGGSSAPTASAVPTGPGPGGYPIDLGGYQGPVPGKKATTIRLLRASYAPAVEEWYAQRYAEFKAAFPRITITEETVPFGNLQQKVQVYVQSKDAPDIMFGRNDLTTYYGAGRMAVPLAPYLTADFLKTQRPSVLDSATTNGDLLLMPWEDGIPMVVLNLDLFEKLGVDLPKETSPSSVTTGWTIEDFIDTLRKLKAGVDRAGLDGTYALEASTLGNGGPGSNYAGYEGHFIRMMGDPQAKKSSDGYKTWAAVDPTGFIASQYLDARGAAAGMKNYQTLFTEGLTPKGAVPSQFAGGTAAVGWEAMSLINRYSASPSPLPFRWAATTVPRGTTFFGCNQAEAPFVSSTSKSQADAVALLGYLTNYDNRVSYHGVRGSVPARDDVIKALPLYEGKAQQLGLAAAKHYVGTPRTPGWSDYSTTANSAIRDIALGADVDSTLKDAARRIDALLAKYK